jgi:7-dehydrocholesterol reductase
MLAMMICSPFFIIFMWYTMVKADGSVEKAYRHFYQHGARAFKEAWPFPTGRACKLVGSFVAFEALLLILLPGERFLGPSTPAGNRPLYTKNGVPCFLTTLGVYYLLWREKMFNPATVYDIIGEIYSVLICLTYFVTILLYMKGHMAPSTSDWGSSGNVLVDFFWGMELYPRISRLLDIKVLMNCRLGIMGWAILVISFAIKQYEAQGKVSDSLMVSSLLMLIYITKFFWTEAAFWCSMEIAHDRAGWFVTYTCLTWIPVVYSSVNLYLVTHPIQLGKGVALTIFIFGMFCIYVVWDCDRQRQLFRHTHGKCRIWGRIPTKIQAHYQTEWGEHKKSLLLTAGWWGLARHIHYAPEIGAAFFWTLPALFKHAMPYFYVTFLTALLIDRANRDDKNCRIKYHKYWEAYSKKVRFKIVPRVF